MLVRRFLTTFGGTILSLAIAICVLVPFSQYASGQDDSAGNTQTEEAVEPSVDYKNLKSPIPYSKRSIGRGKIIFVRMCVECHGPDGKALMDVIADATDLTSPKLWYSGTSEGEVFRSIREGAGVSMPPYKMQLKREDDMWHLVNYVRSLWPESVRPKLQEESASRSSDSKRDDN